MTKTEGQIKAFGQQLRTMLQESDDTRKLDSIEIVAVRAFLARSGITGIEEDPTTIGEWIQWAERHSDGS